MELMAASNANGRAKRMLANPPRNRSGPAANALAFDFPVMIAVAIACLPIFFNGYSINRWEGALFVAYYALYTTYLIFNSSGAPWLGAFQHAMLTFVLPLLWIGFTFVHGGITGWYPYPFLDVTVLGFVPALVNAAVILTASAGLGLIYRFVGATRPGLLPQGSETATLPGRVAGP